MITIAAIAALTTLASPPKSLYDFKMEDIKGKPVPLSKFKGKVLLIVNVASKCGNTPQYAGLQKMFDKYKGQGFAILGFPANEFHAQEPGTNAEIYQFCTAEYGVTFPMFSKIVVKGEGINPLYTWLISNSDRKDQAIEWNFAKFLVDKHGQVVGRFLPTVQPDSPELVAAVEKQLAAK